VIIIGEDELSKGKCVLKDMEKSQQEEIDLDGAVRKICDRLAQRSTEEKTGTCR
jgi:histidyl-tRNA synthetase